MTKTEAIDIVIRAIKNPLVMTSKPMREEVYFLCADYAISAREVLERVQEKVWKT